VESYRFDIRAGGSESGEYAFLIQWACIGFIRDYNGISAAKIQY